MDQKLHIFGAIMNLSYLLYFWQNRDERQFHIFDSCQLNDINSNMSTKNNTNKTYL